jgi:hypothetical protein
MGQTTSSTALMTMRPTPKRRARIVTVFNQPTPAVDLIGAIFNWGRQAIPVADPGPCPVLWCVGCMWGGDAEDPRLHQSAAAIVEAYQFNGISSDLPREVAERVIKVSVERCDGGNGDEPTIVHICPGRREGSDLGPGKARELAAALRKAQASARDLLHRDGVKDGTTGATSVVRVRDYQLQVGAIFDSGTAVVFINYVRTYTAAEQRDHARNGLRFAQDTESWDLLPGEAGRLADAVESAALLVDADRAAAAVSG